VFVSAAEAGRIDAFLKRAFKWSFSKDIVTLDELSNKSGTSIFQTMQCPSHCQNPFIPSTDYNLRNDDYISRLKNASTYFFCSVCVKYKLISRKIDTHVLE